MSPYLWVCAASVYNRELEELNRSTNMARPLKTPRALMDKLFDLEPKLIARIVSGNYECEFLSSDPGLRCAYSIHIVFPARSRRTSMFWHPHCHAFPLQVGGKSGFELAAKLVNGKKASVRFPSVLDLM